MFKPQHMRFPADGWICVVQGGGDPRKILAKIFLKALKILTIIDTPKRQIITIACSNIADRAFSRKKKH